MREKDTLKKISLIFIPFVVIITINLILLNISWEYEPPFSLLLLNTIFIGTISFAIASIIYKGFVNSDSVNILCIGSGFLMIGLGSFFSGVFLSFTDDLNLFVTIYNTCSYGGSIFILIGAVIGLVMRISSESMVWKGVSRRWSGSALYSLIFGGVVLFSLASYLGLIPIFFIQDTGPTLLRQVILEDTAIFSMISSILFMITYFRRGPDFFFWTSISLALISIGFLALLFLKSVESLLGSGGRLMMSLGSIFALSGLLVARREAISKNISLEEVLSGPIVETDQSYTFLVENATDAIVTFDENYLVILWNSAAEQMFGYTRAEAIGSSFPELAMDERCIPIFQGWDQDIPLLSQHAGVPKTIEILGKRKDGTVLTIELIFSHRMHEGRLIHTSILRDITKRKLLDLHLLSVTEGLQEKGKARTEGIEQKNESPRVTQEQLSFLYNQHESYEMELHLRNNEIHSKTVALDASELKYQTLIEALQEGIWAIDKDSNTTFVNLHLAEMLGYTIEEMKNRSLFDFMDGQGREVARQILEHQRSGVKEQHDVEFLRKDGSRMYTSIEFSQLTDNEGTYIGEIAGVMDITHRKQVEEEIKFKNIILVTQQETSLDGILTVDEQGKMISCNKRFVDLWGIPEEVIASQPVELALQPVLDKGKDSDEFIAMVRYLYERTEEESRKEITLVDGRILDRFSAPMYGKDGRYFGRVWYFRDITAQKLAEREILTLNQDLERRVLQRTREFQHLNEELRATNQELIASELNLFRVSEESRVARDYAQSIVDTVREPLIVLNGMFEVLSASRSFYNTFEVSPEETLGKVLYNLGSNQWDIPQLHELLETVLPESTNFDNFNIEHDFPGIGHRNMLLSARRILNETGVTQQILLVIEDITDRKRADEELRRISEESRIARDYAQSIVDTVREPLIVLNDTFKVISASRSFYSTFEVTPEATLGKILYELGDNQWDIPQLHDLLETVLPESTSFNNFNIEHDFPGIGHRNMLLNARRILSETGITQLILLVIEDITDRKRTEAELLRISEESRIARDYALSIIDTVREPLIVLNDTFEVISASRSFYATFEVTREATLGKVLYKLGNNQWDIPQLHELLETVLPESTSFDNFNIEHNFPDIGHRNMLLNARRILSETGITQLILLVIEDITERKRTEEELLRISEESRIARDYAQSIVNTVREPLLVLNDMFEVISASRSFYSTFEVTPEATQGKVLYELGNNQWDIPQLHELLETVLPESTSFDNFNIEHDFPGIGHRNMLLNARRILSETGNTQLILLVIEDITDRKRTEEELFRISEESRVARDYAQSIVNTVREPLIVLNDTFEVISASRSFYATFEVTSEATLGKILYELGDNQWDIPQLHDLLETVLPESTSFDNFNIEHDFPGIGHRNMLLNARRILGVTGTTELILLVIEDITERKKMLAVIEASLAEKEMLLREIHHRVKNNLQIIISLLNLQIRRIKDPVIIETLKDSQSRVRSMALVHEHLYQGKDISHIDLGTYIRALGTGLFQSYEDGRRGVQFDINIREIYVDISIAVPLGLISNELITNSLKYAFPGNTGGILSVTAEENSQILSFSLADNGVGIPEDITLDNQNSMGLRLVNMFIDQLNATVVIERTKGTKYLFTIPKQTEQKT